MYKKSSLTRFSYLLLTFLVLTLFGCKESESSINVSGYVTNGSTPVSEASIDLDGLVQYEVSTNALGYFEIKNVLPGQHDLNIKRILNNNAFSTKTEVIQVSQSLTLDNLILPAPVQLLDPVIEQDFTEDRITLIWNKYTGGDYREYKVYQHPTQGLDEMTGELIFVTTLSSDTSFVTTLPHSAKMYYRVFVLDETSLLAGSNLVSATTNAFVNDPSIELGIEQAFFLNAGEDVWVSFDAIKGEIYKVAWFDSFLSESYPIGGYTPIGDYSAGSVFITAYRADKAIAYFPEIRLMQMDVSPMPLVAEETEKIYIKIRGYDNSTQGTFGVKVSKLDKATAQKIEVDGVSITVPINVGDMKLLYFDGEMGQGYQVSSIATVKSVCCGDGILMHISANRENINSSYFYRESIALANGTLPAIDGLIAEATERTYLVIDGSYWFLPNEAIISVVNQ